MKTVLFVSFALALVMSGCSTTKTSLDSSDNPKEPIPADFKPNNSVLLIEQSVDNDNSSVSVSSTYSVHTDTYMNAYMRKNKTSMIDFADKNYPYKHEFASQNEIYEANSKYSDKNVYRFALVTSITKPSQYTSMNNGMLESTHYQPIFKFYIYDRLNDKTYAALGHGSSLIMWAYKAAINKIKEVKK